MPSNTDILRQALDALHGRAGIEWSSSTDASENEPADGRIILAKDGHSLCVHAQVKSGLRAAHIAMLRERAAATTEPLLVVTQHVGEPMAQALRHAGLLFLDTAGNAHIDDGTWFVFLTGASAPTAPKARLLSPTVWKVAYALLRSREAQELSVRQLATVAGTSSGAASRAIQTLAQRGWVQNLGRGGQAVTDPRALWRAWELGYADRLGPKLYVTRATTPGHGSVGAWVDTIRAELGPLRLLGGEAAASEFGTGLVPSSAVVHVGQWDVQAMASLQLAPSPTGQVTVRRTFGHLNHDAQHEHLADAMLVRAELMSTPDERLDGARETLAHRILERLPDDT